MGEMAAELILSEPPHETGPDASTTPHPRVIPVPGEVILRESTLPYPPAR
jgi:DNA-binding LacI/PurR family transcriptional regulator